MDSNVFHRIRSSNFIVIQFSYIKKKKKVCLFGLKTFTRGIHMWDTRLDIGVNDTVIFVHSQSNNKY